MFSIPLRETKLWLSNLISQDVSILEDDRNYGLGA